MKHCLFIFILSFLSNAQAGYVELSASGNYRTSTIDEHNYSKTISYTGALAYYFWEMSALELNYTEGTHQVAGLDGLGDRYLITTKFRLIGMDLILSFAGRQAPFRPYIKLGGGHQRREMQTEQSSVLLPITRTSEGAYASTGGGFRVMLTDQFALKFGFDAWTSPLNESPVKYDFAASAGISWIF